MASYTVHFMAGDRSTYTSNRRKVAKVLVPQCSDGKTVIAYQQLASRPSTTVELVALVVGLAPMGNGLSLGR